MFLLVFNLHLLRKQIYIFNKHQTKRNEILKQIHVNFNIPQCLALPERRLQGTQQQHPAASAAVLSGQPSPHSYSETLLIPSSLEKVQQVTTVHLTPATATPLHCTAPHSPLTRPSPQCTPVQLWPRAQLLSALQDTQPSTVQDPCKALGV